MQFMKGRGKINEIAKTLTIQGRCRGPQALTLVPTRVKPEAYT